RRGGGDGRWGDRRDRYCAAGHGDWESLRAVRPAAGFIAGRAGLHGARLVLMSISLQHITLMNTENFELKVSEGDDKDVAYLYLPGHRREAGGVTTQVRLRDLLPDYTGADIYLDLDAERRL